MAAPTVVLSPHLDDAVLSCWHLLTREEEVEVVNAFTGLPEEGSIGWWDRLTGADDSAERMHERLEEDRRALELAGSRAANLGLLDDQYRTNGSVPDLETCLGDRLRNAGRVYAPAGLLIGPMTDHALVRNAVLRLRDDVHLYADLPHAALFGLPEWVTGVAPELDVDAYWSWLFEAAGVEPSRPRVHALDESDYARKLEAVKRYRTQLPALEREAPLEVLRWEVTWSP